MSSYTVVEPAAVRFYYEDVKVLQVYMDELRLYFEASPGVKIGIGVSNPQTSFQLKNSVFLNNIANATEALSVQLTNPNYNNEPYSFVPVGTIVIWGAEQVPENWIECNGQSVLQQDYSTLYSLLGYSYTSDITIQGNNSLVDSKKVFQVPDFRGGVSIVERTTGKNVGTRYPEVSGKTPANTDIVVDFAPLRSTYIQQFKMDSSQVPPHRHKLRATVNPDGSPAVRYAMKAHSHSYTKLNASTSVTGGTTKAGAYGFEELDSGSTNYSHKHTVTNVRLQQAYENPKNLETSTTWNNPFSIEQQYIIMKYIIKAL